MVAAAMNYMASNFAKLDKFEGVNIRRWQNKMHFLLSSMSVVYVLTTPMPEDGGDNPIVDKSRKGPSGTKMIMSAKTKYMAEDALSKKFLVSNFTNNKMTDSRPVMEQYNELLIPHSWKDFKHTLKHLKDELTLVELGNHHLSLRSPSGYNDNKGKRKHHDNTNTDPNKKAKLTCWKCGKTGHIKRDCKGVNVGNKANGSGIKGSVDGSSNSLKGQNMFNKSLQVYYVTYVFEAYFVQDDDVAWWVESREIVHVCKDRCWFKTYESLHDGSILHIGNESTALMHRRGCVDLRLSSGKIVSLFNVLHVPNIRKNLVSSSVLNNCGYKQVIESNKYVLSKHDVFIGFGYLSNHIFRLNIVNDNIGSAFMSTFKLNDSILWHTRLGHVHFKRMQDMYKDGLIPAFDMDTEKCKTCMLIKITNKPFPNVKRKTEVLELIHSDLCDFHATPSLRNNKYFMTFIDDALRAESWVLRAVVRLFDPKLKTLSERGIECIFVGCVEHSKAFRFFVIEPNDSIAINSIIKSRFAIFDEIFSSVPRPSLRIRNRTEDIGGLVVPEEVTKKDDPKTFDEVMKSQYVAFWKEAINDKMDSIMGNNTWVLADLPPGCKPFGCKWIFKRKLKVDGTVEKFKARLVIQGCKQKSRIDYFDTYALVARISTIRLMIDMASSHNMIIHQMDVKTAFLNGELEEEVESHYIEKVLKKFNYFDSTSVSTPMDTSEKLMPNNGQPVSQLKYSRVIGCLMYVMTCTRPDITFVIGKLSRYTSNHGTQQAIQPVLKYLKKTINYRLMYTPVLEGYTHASWINNTKDNLSTSGWVFLLGGGAISWSSKKQTCITGSTMESEFVALAVASKEAECAATLAKTYSQMYNGKSRQLGVRHSMIRELIINGVVSIEFVRYSNGLKGSILRTP
ncbi:zinc finger, CCHC-type containing protein [Tanacetum coccineum]